MLSSTRFLSRLLIINALYFGLTTFTSIDVRAHGGHDHGKEKTNKIVQEETPKLIAAARNQLTIIDAAANFWDALIRFNSTVGGWPQMK